MNQPPIKPKWLDSWLEKLLRPVQTLPVVTAERTARQQHRRLQWVTLGMLAALVAILGGLLLAFGAGQAMPLKVFLEVVVALPLIVAALFYAALYVTLVRNKRDDGDHPWRFAVTGKGLRIERSGGAKLHDGAWSDWRFVGYKYISVKHQRSVTRLELALNGEQLTIDLNRVPGGLALARAVVQQLAIEGDK
jgi:hypothetical protein